MLCSKSCFDLDQAWLVSAMSALAKKGTSDAATGMPGMGRFRTEGAAQSSALLDHLVGKGETTTGGANKDGRPSWWEGLFKSPIPPINIR
jgi:hypothetical protein